MIVNIRLLTGKHYTVEVGFDSTIQELKSIVSPIVSIKLKKLVFIYNSKMIENDSLVGDIIVDPDSFIVATNSSLMEDDEKKSDKSFKTNNKKFSENAKMDKNGNDVPWNIDSLIKYITNLKYSVDHARLALEHTNYDLHQAISLLSTGKSVGVDGAEHSCSVVPEVTYDKNLYVNYEEPEDPPLPARRSEEEKKFAETLNSFSEEERQAIDRLSVGLDQTIVVQVYMACDKDEVLTENCLQTMI